MLQQKVTITNEIGIHARPASQLIRFLSNYKSKITIENGDKEGDARSIIHLLALAIKKDNEITVKVDGEDETEAMPDIIEFLKNLED